MSDENVGISGQTRVNRRGLIAAGGLAAAALVIPSSARLRLSTASATGGATYWCAADTYNLDSGWAAYTAALEQKQGRGFAGVRMNGGFGSPAPDFAELHKDVAAGRAWTYVNGKPQGAASGYWRAVAAGVYDAAFVAFIQRVQADATWTPARPLRYSFHHEQSVSSEGGGTQAGSAADYAAAWNHVAGLIDQAGAHVSQGGNMLRCWTPHWLQVSRDPAYRVTTKSASSSVAPLLASKILAGGLDTTKLDLVGADIYCTSTQSFTADDQWTPLHRLGAATGKPVFTGETGIAGGDAKVVAWLKRLDALAKSWGAGSGPGQLHAICWTSRVAAGGDYRLDASAKRLAQYRAMALDAFYGATT